MASKSGLANEEQPCLPPIIIVNPRKKIQAEQVPIVDIQLPQKDKTGDVSQLIPYPIKEPPVPTPKFPLHITWYPNSLCLTLEDDPVISKFWIWNLCKRSIYFNCCGLWGEMAQFGASWRCFPRTRIRLSPGLRSELFVKATPRELATVPKANASIQIAAGHVRDNVTGYFSIPIHVQFSKYVLPVMDDAE